MKALIIYEDLSSFTKAYDVLQNSARKADVNVVWNIKPWRVDMLKFPPTAQEALKDAIDAHLIMFDGRSAQLLPFWLQDWLEKWAKYRRVEDAVLAVIGAGNAAVLSTVAKSDLSQFARHRGLNVIFDNAFSEASLDEPKLTEFLILPQTLDAKNRDEENRDWGIND
jgi:hypothetical protein